MATIGNGVTLRGLTVEELNYTFNISGTVTQADEGMAVMIDSAAANTVKAATDGALILGQMAIFEDRTIEGIKLATVPLKGGYVFTVDPEATSASPDETPAVGDYLVGAATAAGKAGYVRKATTAEIAEGKRNWLVVEVIDSGARVVAIGV